MGIPSAYLKGKQSTFFLLSLKLTGFCPAIRRDEVPSAFDEFYVLCRLTEAHVDHDFPPGAAPPWGCPSPAPLQCGLASSGISLCIAVSLPPSSSVSSSPSSRLFPARFSSRCPVWPGGASLLFPAVIARLQSAPCSGAKHVLFTSSSEDPGCTSVMHSCDCLQTCGPPTGPKNRTPALRSRPVFVPLARQYRWILRGIGDDMLFLITRTCSTNRRCLSSCTRKTWSLALSLPVPLYGRRR